MPWKTITPMARQPRVQHKGDKYKKVIAWMIRKNTTVFNHWIASNLFMGHTTNVSKGVSEVTQAQQGLLWELKQKTLIFTD